jgi:hypothetical protein
MDLIANRKQVRKDCDECEFNKTLWAIILMSASAISVMLMFF